MDTENEINKIGYYAVIPSSVLFCKELKANEKLLYALITVLANKEGYCFASNKYLASKFFVDHSTVSKWISHLRKLGFIREEIIKDENKKFIIRKIYPSDSVYRQNNQYTYGLKNQEAIGEKNNKNNIKENNKNEYIVEKKKNKFMNCEQRTYSEKDLMQLYANFEM